MLRWNVAYTSECLTAYSSYPKLYALPFKMYSYVFHHCIFYKTNLINAKSDKSTFKRHKDNLN